MDLFRRVLFHSLISMIIKKGHSLPLDLRQAAKLAWSHQWSLCIQAASPRQGWTGQDQDKRPPFRRLLQAHAVAHGGDEALRAHQDPGPPST